jgi:serine/threonine protein kinase
MQILKPGDTFADNYRLVRLVDTGGFAAVWEALFIRANHIVALKIFPALDPDGVKNIENEYKNQANLLHTNLVTARNFGVYEGQPYLEMLFFGGGNAAKLIGNSNELTLAKCLQQISNGLSYLHAKEIVHQDIKPNNFLLDDDGNFYLADLGLSVKIRQTIQRYTEAKSVSQVQSTMRQTTGSTPPCYRAPELYERPSLHKPPIKATDIWSLGASIYEMANGDVPFGDMGGIMQVNSPEPPDLPASFSPQLNSIIKDTWNRPKASEFEDWAATFVKTGRWPSVEPVTGAEVRGSRSTIVSTDKPYEEPAAIQPKPASSFPKGIVIFLVLVILGGGIAYFVLSSGKKKNNEMGSGNPTTQVADSTRKPKDTATPVSPGTVTPPIAVADEDGDGVPDSKDKCPHTPKGEKVDKHGCSLVQRAPIRDGMQQLPDPTKRDAFQH